MTDRPLSQIDVNLLVTLDVLLDAGSVTQAARRLGLTQPAVSQALGRLRSLFDDPLMVRQGSRMVPTPRARALAAPLRQLLSDLQALVADQPRFEPATATHRFTLGTNDYVAQTLLPPLMARLQRDAPGIDLACRGGTGEGVAESLAHGDLDLALGVLPSQPGAVLSQPVLEETFTCLLRSDHPLADRLDLTAFAEAGHVLVSPRGQRGSVVERALAEHGLTRRVVMEVPFFLGAPYVLAQTDLIATLPRRVAETFSRSHALSLRAPPLLLPGFSITMYWHTRYDREPALAWLRGEIEAVCAGL